MPKTKSKLLYKKSEPHVNECLRGFLLQVS